MKIFKAIVVSLIVVTFCSAQENDTSIVFLAKNEKPEQTNSVTSINSGLSKGDYPPLEPVLSLVMGAIVGGLIGAVAGYYIHDESYPFCYNSRDRGVILGASIISVVNYELMLKRNHISTEKRIGLYTGLQSSLALYSNMDTGTNFSIGLHRSYRVSRRLDLLYTINYGWQKFTLKDRKVFYSDDYFIGNRLSDIQFSVAYLDIGVMPRVYVLDSDWRVSVAAGPMVSVQLSDKTKFTKADNGTSDPKSGDYDFHYQSYGSDGTYPYPGFGVQLSVEYGHYIGAIKMTHSLVSTQQIYPLEESVRMGTVQFLLGYYF